jgi:hypothetical protein
MTDSEKKTMVRTLVENDAEATDEIIAVYLTLACNAMLERLFPYDSDKDSEDLPVRYDVLQCELAARYFLRRGGQGEINHEENGVNRQYASVDDEDILQRLTPFAKVGG